MQPRKNRFVPSGTVVPDGQKWCPDCDTVKPFEQFPRTATSTTGRATYCLPCHNARGKASRDKIGGARAYHLARRYGISAEEFDVMCEAQGGLCAICLSAPAQHVDHDHETGRVRQLLCFNCNGGLGQFRDDPGVLRSAARYIEHHRGQAAAADLPPSAPSSTRRGARSSSEPAHLGLRRRAAGCGSHDVVRTRVAYLIASLDPSAHG